MAMSHDAYSRTVGTLKVALPLAAILILSGLFLLSAGREAPDAGGDEAASVVRDQRIGAPDYAGVTRDGAAIRVVAESARPDPDGGRDMTGKALRARIDLPDGSDVTMRANDGAFDAAAARLTLAGAVQIRSSAGYALGTERLIAATDLTRVASDGTVAGHGPAGRLEAGRMEIGAADGERYRLSFRDGVRVRFTPEPAP